MVLLMVSCKLSNRRDKIMTASLLGFSDTLPEGPDRF